MSSVHSPIHRADVFGQELRFFSSPIYMKQKTADMPWHVFNDLLAALGLDEKASIFILRELRGDWAEPQTIATPDGLVTIAPHFMADGLIDAVGADSNFQPENFKLVSAAYRRNLTEALKQMIPNFDPIGRLLFAVSCMRGEQDE